MKNNTGEKQARAGNGGNVPPVETRFGGIRANKRNNNGRPKSFDALRSLAQKIAAEELNGADGEIVTRIEALLRVMSSSRNPADRRNFLEYAFGKPKDEPDNNADIMQAASDLPAHLIAPDYLSVWRAMRNGEKTRFVLRGGRGSTKSSFAALALIVMLTNPKNSDWHAVAIRRVANTLRESVFNQIKWAISELGLDDKFDTTVSPMEITYKPTKQKIYFRGMDDPAKLKSIKPPFGYLALLWFEELDQFNGEEEIRNIEQSILRGGDTAIEIMTYNPPRTSANWVNKWITTLADDPRTIIHTADYRNVPPEWLGKVFLENAETLRTTNEKAYRHEYLGEIVGLGDVVFDNLQLREITDGEIAQFDNILHGLDFGYYPHPAHYTRMHYDATKRILYIIGETRKWKFGNREMYDAMVAEGGYNPSELLICDSEDNKSIADFRAFGAYARGAMKGAGSVRAGIRWLQSLSAIVVDQKRTPYTAQELQEYVYQRLKDGEVIEAYPDSNDDAVASIRYGTNPIWRIGGE